jgi:hypothetical protein
VLTAASNGFSGISGSTFRAELIGSLKFSHASLHTCQVLGPRRTLGNLAYYDSSVLASCPLTKSPSVLINANGAEYAPGRCVSLLAYMFPCVRFACLVRLNPFIRASISVTHATLGMGGWLTLTQPGLAPGKKRQASLDALTHKPRSKPAIAAQKAPSGLYLHIREPAL